MAISIQDKHQIPNDPTFRNFISSRYQQFFADEGFWWLEPMPTLTLGNLSKRVQYARRMAGMHGSGDPVWGASVIHLIEQAAGTPFSIEGPESAVRKAMKLLFSAPGGYREMIKQICYNWVVSDMGAPVEIIWGDRRQIRDGVYYPPTPVGLDVFDPTRLRLIASQNAAYPYVYLSDRHRSEYADRPNWPYGSNEIPISREAVGRIVNAPQTDEELLGCGISPASIALPQWQIAMGFLALLLQDGTNTSAYSILLGKHITEQQVVEAMQNRATRIAEGHTHAMASALMLFANEDALGDGDSGPSIQSVPLRRYADGWDWRSWLEERIQIYSTILGISPMSIIMSIYARANQAGAQYAADEAGVRRTSLMTGLADILADLVGHLGATFQYRSQRLADNEREFLVRKTANEAWVMLYQANINGIPLMAPTPEQAAERVRRMMADQRLINPDWAEGEDYVVWDTDAAGVIGGAKQMAFLSGALRKERYIIAHVDPSGDSTRTKMDVIGHCTLREPGRPVQWTGMSIAEMKAVTPIKQAMASLRAAHSGAMIALYLSAVDAEALALPHPKAEPAEKLHITLAYIPDAAKQPISMAQARQIVRILAGKLPAIRVTVGGTGLFGSVQEDGTRTFYASINSDKLHELHHMVVDRLEGIGAEITSTHGGYQPHMTLAYTTPDDGILAEHAEITPREITLDRIALAWRGQFFDYPLLPMETRETGAVPAKAPRRQREVQTAWQEEVERDVKKLRRALETTIDPPTFTPQQAETLQSYLDRWDMGRQALGDDERFSEKHSRVDTWVRSIQEELDKKEKDRNAKMLLAALAVLTFAFSVQRRGAERLREGMMLSGMPADDIRLLNELTRLGAYIQGSLLPDMIIELMEHGKIGGRLERRMIIFYGGAVWSAMQLSTVLMAAEGARLRVEGPRDANNCQESDPGDGIACAAIVGQEYTVGQDYLPVLGRDTKCGQACRHWWEVASAS